MEKREHKHKEKLLFLFATTAINSRFATKKRKETRTRNNLLFFLNSKSSNVFFFSIAHQGGPEESTVGVILGLCDRKNQEKLEQSERRSAIVSPEAAGVKTEDIHAVL